MTSPDPRPAASRPSPIARDVGLRLYRGMQRIRQCEEQLARAHQRGPGPRGLPHLRRPGGDRDRRLRPPAGRRRGLQHPPRARPRAGQGRARRCELIAELFGRATGCSRGRGGSMHLFAPEVGLMGTSGIVGPCILQAAGAGYSFRLLKTDHVAVAFFGDGAVNNGAFHEGLNLAAIWKLPVLFVCENNQFATEVPVRLRRRQPGRGVAGRPCTGCPASRWTATTCWPSTRPPARPSPRARGGRRADAAGVQDLPHPAARRGHGRLRLPHPRGGRGLEGALPDPPAARPRWSPTASPTEDDCAAIDAEVEPRSRGRATAGPRRAPGPTPPTRRRTSTPSRATPGPRRRPRTPARSVTFMQATLEALAERDGARTRGSSCWARGSASAAATSGRPPGCTTASARSGCATRRSASAASSAWPAARR